MRPTQHPSNNRVLGAPPGFGAQCNALPVTHYEEHGMHSVMSAWLPDAAELAALNAGKPVLLVVAGSTMPPVMLFAEL